MIIFIIARDSLMIWRRRRSSARALRVYCPCLSAFLLPRGAPEPGAPPCIRHRAFPLTAGAMHGSPERPNGAQLMSGVEHGMAPSPPSQGCPGRVKFYESAEKTCQPGGGRVRAMESLRVCACAKSSKLGRGHPPDRTNRLIGLQNIFNTGDEA